MLAIIFALLLQAEPVQGPLIDSIAARIESRLEANEATSDTRYHGLRNMLQELRDRPTDHTALFPLLNSLVKESKAAREEAVQTVGPIREAIQLLSQLVTGLIVLVVLSFAFSIYKQVTAKA